MAKTWFAPEEEAAFAFAQAWQREHQSTFVALVAQLEPVNAGGKAKECQIPFLLMGTDKRPYRLIVSLKKFGRIWHATQIRVLNSKGGTKMSQEVVRLFHVSESWRGFGRREGYYIVVSSEEPRLIMGESPNRAEEMIAQALAATDGSAYKSHGQYDSWSARELSDLGPYTAEVAEVLAFHGVESVEDLADCYLLWYQEFDEDGQGDFEQISSNLAADFVIQTVRGNIRIPWTHCTVEVRTSANLVQQPETVVVPPEDKQGTGVPQEVDPESEAMIRGLVAESIQNWMPKWSAGINVSGYESGFRMGRTL